MAALTGSIIEVDGNLTGKLSGTGNMTGELGGIKKISGRMIVPREVLEKNHANLYNRDLPDQHPIEAITKLPQELENRVSYGDTLSNSEIEAILLI